MQAALVGRDRELDAIEAFLGRGHTEPASLVLFGEAGIGKTCLWQAGVEIAREHFRRALVCRTVEAEASLAFAALSDLLAACLDEVRSVLAGPRLRALDVALLVAEPGSEPADLRAVGVALLDALRHLSSAGPVLFAVDDVQWLDPSSARALSFALRRLRREPVAVLATVRGHALPPDLLGLEDVEGVPIGPLSLGALHHLLRDRLGLELRRPELARLYEATGGNPFFAVELGRELQRLDAKLAVDQPLPVPGDLKELLAGRLARLPRRTRATLLSVAALARPSVDVLVDVHGRQATDALERAQRAGVVEVADSRIRFTHPLLAAICYQDAPPWQRREAHRSLAAAVRDPEERTRHLALASEGPSAGVATSLDRAGEQAAGRGATAAAAELLELAAKLTPSGDETGRRRRLLRAADFHCFSGDRARAKEIPARLLDEVPPGPERARVLFKIASARQDELPAIVHLCDQALAEAGAADPALSAEILAFTSWVRLERDLPGALADARAALDHAEEVDDPGLVAAAIARAAIAELITGEITPGLLERGLSLEERADGLLEFHQSPRAVLARYQLRTGDLDAARAILETAEDEAAARGDEGTRGHVLWILIMVEWLAGRWDKALERADVAVELGEQVADPQYHASVLTAAAIVHAYRGEVEEARRSAEEALAIAEAVSDEAFLVWSLGVIGHLELALGNVEAAARRLAGLPARLQALGWNDPMVPLWSDALDALLLSGEFEQLRAFLPAYEERARKLGRPWSLEVAGRCRGLLAAADGDLALALEILEGTVAGMPHLPYPFERARTLLALGSVRRRAKQKRAARAALDRALAEFEALGARLWAQKARDELARVSGRRRAGDDLTEMERRVGLLAAQGLANKQIAAELSMSVHTVEAHLSRTYRKLGVRSRTDLPGRLATSTEDLAKM